MKSSALPTDAPPVRFLHLFGAGAAWGIAAMAVAKASAFLLKLVIARIGITEFGTYFFVTTIFTNTATLTAFGLPMAVTRFIALYRSKRSDKTSLLITSSLTLLAVSGTVTTAVVYLYPGLTGSPPQYTQFLRVTATGFVGMQIIYLTRAILFGMLKAAPAYIIDMTEQLGKLMCTIAAVFLLGSLVGNALWGYVAGIYLAAATGLIMTRKLIPRKLGLTPAARPLISYAWPVSVSEIITSLAAIVFLIRLQSDSGAYGVGEYAVAVTAASLFFVLPQAVLPLYLPYVTALNGTPQAVSKAQQRMTLALGIPTLFLFTALLFFGRTMISLIFGSGYTGALTAVVTLSAAHALYAVFVWPNRQILDARGRTGLNLAFTAVRVGVVGIILWLSVSVTPSVLAGAIGVGWIAEGVVCMIAVNRVLRIKKA